MPNRILRDGILSSERIAALGWPEEVFYRRLMSVVDDYGRYYATSMLLRAACYPLHLDKVSDADIGKWLQATEKAGLVSVYPAPDGKRYLQLADFRQQVRAKDSRFPAPDAHMRSTCTADAKQVLANAHLDVDVDVDVDERPQADVPDPFAGIARDVVRDFKAMRSKQRAAITPTAVAGIKREADKAGITLEAALVMCCERNWRGFKADWVTDSPPGKPSAAPLPRLQS